MPYEQVRSGNALARVALFIWPVFFGLTLILYGFTRPEPVFGLPIPHGLTFMVTGVCLIASALSHRPRARALALSVITLCFLGRSMTLLFVGESTVGRTRELGAALVWFAWWLTLVMLHFVTTPVAVSYVERER
jgi:hypothetical protein